jgi:hypothetical protein
MTAYNDYLKKGQEDAANEEEDDDVQVQEEGDDDLGDGSTESLAAEALNGALESLREAALELPDVAPIEHSLMSVKRRRT